VYAARRLPLLGSAFLRFCEIAFELFDKIGDLLRIAFVNRRGSEVGPRI